MSDENADYTPQGTDWDNREEIGFFPAFGKSLIEVSIRPFDFFRHMTRGPEFGGALLFLLIISIIVGFVDFFWDVMGVGAGLLMSGLGEDMDSSIPASLLASPFTIILTPVFVLITVFVWAGILHLCLMILGAARAGFENTLKVACYAEAPAVLVVIPVCGSQIGIIWSLVLTVIGLQVVHRTGTAQAIGAVILPALICCGGAIGIAMLFGLALFGLESGL